MSWARNVTCMEEMVIAHKVLIGKLEETRWLGRHRHMTGTSGWLL
jgi:hypothetical protein